MRNCAWIQFVYTTRTQELNTMSTFWAFASWRQRWAISSTWEGHRRSKCETLTTSSFLSRGSRRHVMADSLIVVTGPYNTGTLNTKFSENKGFLTMYITLKQNWVRTQGVSGEICYTVGQDFSNVFAHWHPLIQNFKVFVPPTIWFYW